MINPSQDDFKRLSSNYSLIPLYLEKNADFDTVLSLFHKVQADFLLESVENGDNVGRYSIIAAGKKCRFTFQQNQLTIENFKSGKCISTQRHSSPNPLDIVKKRMQTYGCPPLPADFPPFFGGLIGYLGYETVTYFEAIPTNPGLEAIPDGILIIPERLLIADNVKRSVTIVVPVSLLEGDDYPSAVKIIEEVETQISRPSTYRARSCSVAKEVTSNFKKEEFLKAVETCKDHIAKGDMIQIVLSQQFSMKTDAPPFELYRTLRRLNPSPYLYYLDYGDFQLIGSSPEVMVRLIGDKMLLKPIAGTRPRGQDEEEDAALARSLIEDPKERAEHLMLVDLGRNDLGRVAKAGSVEVSGYMAIERYSHVMHIVSTVSAKIAAGKDAYDLIAATFPAGTLSGAPKIRAMEIIAQLESQRRGPYGGMVLALGYNGNLNSCITIRTILTQKGTATIQAGAGVVADSIAEKEYQETQFKSAALIKAIRKTVADSSS